MNFFHILQAWISITGGCLSFTLSQQDCVQQVLEFWDIYYWFDPLANSDSDTKSIKVSGQDGPLQKICLVLAFLARDIVSREVEVQFSPCPVIIASLVLKLGLLELLNPFCTSCSKKVYKSDTESSSVVFWYTPDVHEWLWSTQLPTTEMIHFGKCW